MNPKKKIYLSLAIFGIIDILLVVFVICPLFKNIQKKSDELISQKQELATLKKEKEDYSKVASFYKDYHADLEKIDNLFIDPEAIIEFINFLENNAVDSQIKITISSLVQQKASSESQPWPDLSFQISASGSPPDFLKFLGKLEVSPFLIEISDLNIKTLTSKDLSIGQGASFSPGDINATFSIKVYTR